MRVAEAPIEFMGAYKLHAAVYSQIETALQRVVYFMKIKMYRIAIRYWAQWVGT